MKYPKMQNKIINFLIQWRVIIPLALIVLIWFFWPQPKPNTKIVTSSTKATSLSNNSSKQEVAITSLFGVKKKLRCSIESATAVIDDVKISASLTENKKQNKVIFDGDCLYRWTNGSSSGERSCGLKPYLPLLSSFVSNDSLQKAFPQSNELASACKEVSSINQKVFEIPKTVLFKNKKLF